MNEEEAHIWCSQRFDDDRVALLERFAAMVVAENDHQNLISPATCASIWSRHVTDSAQLLGHRPEGARSWLDIGSGPGFPGIIVALLSDMTVTLVEPRGRRIEFLNSVVDALGIANAHVVRGKAEALEGSYHVISARAVASIPNLLTMTRHLRTKQTRLILPRGRNGATEVAELPATLRRMFHVEQSITDPESVIVIADGVLT